MTDQTQDQDVVPEAEADYGIARIYISGDEDTSFSEMMEEFNEQKEDMLENIEDLKRLEQELYDGDGGASMPQGMVQ